jgi:hypothetical protein
MSTGHRDIEEAIFSDKKMKKQKHTNTQIIASAGNTKVKVANGTDGDGVSPAFVISSSSEIIINSIMTLFSTYDKISTQHKLDREDTVSRDVASSHIKLEFKLVKTKPTNGSSDTADVAIVERSTSSKGVTCTSLRSFMEERTKAVSYQRVLRMGEMIYEQMKALEAVGLAPPYYGLDDILVINKSFFCFINDAKLFEAKMARIDVTRAISRSAAFFAPELIGGISALPYSADVRSSYYSYGLLVAYCATLNSKLLTSHEKGQEGEKEEQEEEEEENGADEEIEQQSGGKRRRRRDNQPDQVKPHNRRPNLNLMRALEPLQYTKLYWLILRCCDPDVVRRSIIYV